MWALGSSLYFFAPRKYSLGSYSGYWTPHPQILSLNIPDPPLQDFSDIPPSPPQIFFFSEGGGSSFPEGFLMEQPLVLATLLRHNSISKVGYIVTTKHPIRLEGHYFAIQPRAASSLEQTDWWHAQHRGYAYSMIPSPCGHLNYNSTQRCHWRVLGQTGWLSG